MKIKLYIVVEKGTVADKYVGFETYSEISTIYTNYESAKRDFDERKNEFFASDPNVLRENIMVDKNNSEKQFCAYVDNSPIEIDLRIIEQEIEV
jgi:hypothetical protein